MRISYFIFVILMTLLGLQLKSINAENMGKIQEKHQMKMERALLDME